MSPAGDAWTLELDPGLVEETVLLALEAQPTEEQRTFRRQRDPLYERVDAEGRETAFRALHARWLERLGLVAPLHAALRRLPRSERGPSRCLVLPARSARDERGDVYAAEPAPVVVLQLTTTTWSSPARLRPFLARELLHVSDLLDPTFGYVPGAPLPGVRRQLVHERYRLLWRATVDGRLAATGALGPVDLAARSREFAGALAPVTADPEALLERLLAVPRPTHPQLMALAEGASGSVCLSPFQPSG